MGDVLAFNAQITPTNTDVTPEDNLLVLIILSLTLLIPMILFVWKEKRFLYQR
jgi:hypothetical protein